MDRFIVPQIIYEIECLTKRPKKPDNEREALIVKFTRLCVERCQMKRETIIRGSII
jgi:hypothetical protein